MEESEKEKMLRGGMYRSKDPDLLAERAVVKRNIQQLQMTPFSDQSKRQELIYKIFPYAGKNLYVESPVYCDYGYNVLFGDDCSVSFNCVFLDGVSIKIGDRVKFGPNVQVYTARHPMEAKIRRNGPEDSRPITIGDDTLIGESSVIVPGVNIGKRVIVSAGSVVTRDISDDSVVAGSPARIVDSSD